MRGADHTQYMRERYGPAVRVIASCQGKQIEYPMGDVRYPEEFSRVRLEESAHVSACVLLRPNLGDDLSTWAA